MRPPAPGNEELRADASLSAKKSLTVIRIKRKRQNEGPSEICEFHFYPLCGPVHTGAPKTTPIPFSLLCPSFRTTSASDSRSSFTFHCIAFHSGRRVCSWRITVLGPRISRRAQGPAAHALETPGHRPDARRDAAPLPGHVRETRGQLQGRGCRRALHVVSSDDRKRSGGRGGRSRGGACVCRGSEPVATPRPL